MSTSYIPLYVVAPVSPAFFSLCVPLGRTPLSGLCLLFQDTMSYQDMVKLTEDRKAQNSIKDNMENYRKLLFLGKPLLLQALEHPPPSSFHLQGGSR